MSVGRQQLVYDSRHLLGNRNWNQNGIQLRCPPFQAGSIRWNLHVAGSWNTLNENHPTTTTPTHASNPTISFGLTINSLATLTSPCSTCFWGNRNRFNQYPSFQANHRILHPVSGEDLKFWANAYYQYGRNKLGKTVGAFLMDADMCYSIGKLTPGIGFGYLSGNSHVGVPDNQPTTFSIFSTVTATHFWVHGLLQKF